VTPRITEAARDEVAGVARWYDTQPSRYGAEFLGEFEAALLAIAANPRLYPLAEDGVPGKEVREYLIERFKQRVLYLMNGEDAVVISVVHASRRPGSWRYRLTGSE
jgi:hypothetical protein